MEEEEKKCPPGAPMWMTTFSDMMTLLLTFFVLLLSMANIDPVKLSVGTQSVSDALASVNFFHNTPTPGEPSHELVLIPSPIFKEKVSKDKSPSEKKKMENENDKNKKKQSQDSEEEKKQAQAEAEQNTAIAQANQKEMSDITKNVQMSFKDDIAKGAINFKSEKDRIVIEYPAEDSFKSGSNELTDKMKRATQQLSFMLKDKNVSISIAGYTDSIPIKTGRFRSNWDLSVMRASSVANEMLRYVKFAPEQIEVKGYGEGHPKASNATAEGRKQNRRLEIVIEPQNSSSSPVNISNKKAQEVISSDTVNKKRVLNKIR